MKSFREQPHNRARGGEGESAAIRWLESHGYRIIVRNMRTKAGEIDVIAIDGGTLCFIEIKARSSQVFGPAIGAVDARKQRRIARAAMLYLTRNPTDLPCRFDVVGLDLGEDGWEVTLIQDAFQMA